MKFRRRSFLTMGVPAGAALAMAQSTSRQRANPTNRDLQRAEDLLRQMTIEEKAMQLSCVMPLALLDRDGLMRGRADTLINQGIGHVAGIGLLGHKEPEAIAR